MKSRKLGRKLRVENLEDRRMLATINWTNEFTTNGFDSVYGADAVLAKTIVNRAIDDWESVITSFNYDSTFFQDTLDIEISAQALGDGIRGTAQINTYEISSNKPLSGTITLDDNGAGTGWFFDQTPLDDAEFTGLAGSFQASFIDASTAGQQSMNDYYRTILHEIGHVLGTLIINVTTLNSGENDPLVVDFQNGQYVAQGSFALTVDTQDFFLGELEYVGVDQIDQYRLLENYAIPGTSPAQIEDVAFQNELWQYTMSDDTTVTFTEAGGGHFYEGPPDGSLGADQHLYELMNSGRSVSSGTTPEATTRQFISDLTVKFLEDVFGYSIVLPSILDTTHATLDTLGGTLLVQGSPRDDTGAGANDTIDISVVGDQIQVVVNTPNINTTELFDLSAVNQIVIAGHDGADTITVASELEDLRKDVEYVVSSNEDEIESSSSVASGVLGDGIVDINTDIPGSQATLRAAVMDANDAGLMQSIYLPPTSNGYTLLRTIFGGESGHDASVYDLDIDGDVTIIGAGAGLSVIDGGQIDRIFDLQPSMSEYSLALSGVTLTQGQTTSTGIAGYGGAIRVGDMSHLFVSDSAFVGNESVNSAGGAIAIVARGIAHIDSSAFIENEADQGGGAIGTLPNGQVDMRSTIGSSVFYGNLQNGVASSVGGYTANEFAISLGNNLTDVAGAAGNVSLFTESGDVVGSADIVVTGVADRIDVNDAFTSLREAVIDANATPGTTIWVPGWDFHLGLTGDESDASNVAVWDTTVNDLDITGYVDIVGVGPGLTVIDAQGIDRIFDLPPGMATYSLDIDRVTLTGGSTSTAGFDGYGGAIRVGDYTDLSITNSAIVGNESISSSGGGIAVIANGSAAISASVFVDNRASWGGAAVSFVGSSTINDVSSISESIFSNNLNGTTPSSVTGSMGSEVLNGGNNLSDIDGSVDNVAFFGSIGTVDYVVTSIEDTFNAVPNDNQLSLREAVNKSNNTTGTQEIWMPAWNFLLTRESHSSGIDPGVSVGDLDITEDLTIRGIGGSGGNQTSVAWRQGITDKVFELLGDYNEDGQTTTVGVDAADYTVWRDSQGQTGSNLAADGNDDGVIDSLDYDIWVQYYGNTLDLFDIDIV